MAGLLRRMAQALPELETWRRRVDDLGRSVHTGAAGCVQLARSRIEGMKGRLNALDPVATLNRGFSVVENLSSHQVVTSTGQAATGDPLAITVGDGQIPATVGPTNVAKPARKKRKAAPQPMERLL